MHNVVVSALCRCHPFLVVCSLLLISSSFVEIVIGFPAIPLSLLLVVFSFPQISICFSLVIITLRIRSKDYQAGSNEE